MLRNSIAFTEMKFAIIGYYILITNFLTRYEAETNIGDTL